MSFIELEQVYKRYKMGEVTINALDGTTFSVEQGELCIILGPSGAGKTTVLNILGGIDACNDGKVRINGSLINGLDKKRLAKYRRQSVGFVFQFYNLVANLTALENVELATQISEKPLDPIVMLRNVGLGDRMNNFPSQLSGGEQQRVSIARALAKNPSLLLCDEPTGALDYKTGKQILSLLQQTSIETGMTVIIVTHNTALTPMADRVITMRNGRVSRIAVNDTPLNVEDLEW
ncbi:MAG: ABC transporter ATP-binding protein [Clostridia bacterium]|nr:ABC transporter ATP-binding protein [Clostridia bacterium]